MKIVEMFVSIEGEGVLAGRSAAFARLYGCNLRCEWCDTKYSYDPASEFLELEIDEIFDFAKRAKTEIVSITGGEPFLCENLRELCEKLLTLKRLVKIETNGTIWREIPSEIYLAVSPKPQANFRVKEEIANRANELKFIVDRELNSNVILDEKIRAIYDRGAAIVLQLENNREESLKKAILIQRELYDRGILARIGAQLHKLLSLG
ncbi:MAG: 7-carboxy-7-deazaguanine synthase QueE [Helicobacteraceae bacterium]|jgi:organic radical activating enzyme|nr:7-carboxy-7-deazaguanine synthase QueE [Helicobacteraceae bacterium]